MTQEKLAELASLNYKYIGRVELGKADPGADVLVRLARALAVPVGDLFETITPGQSGPRALPRADVDRVTETLRDLTRAVEHLLASQPSSDAAKPQRRSSR